MPGENVPGDPVCRGSLFSPTQSTYMAFTHMLPGASTRGLVPPSLPRRHTLLFMCQQTWESSVHTTRLFPLVRDLRTLPKGDQIHQEKHEHKQENVVNVGQTRKAKTCSLLWASAHSCLSSYLSTVTESTSPLPSIQPFTAKWMLLNQRGLQIFLG